MSVMPIILLMVLMGKLNWGAAKAAPVTLLFGLVISIVTFKADFSVLSVELLKALWSSLSIVLVIFTALLLYEVSKEAATFKTLYRLVHQVAPNELIRILLIGVCFASFLQGFTGFGVPVLVTAPLLLQMGLAPYWAVMVPLLGHSWGGTYGTFALAWKTMLDQLNVQDASFSASAAGYAALFLVVSQIYIVFSYGKWKAIKKGTPALLVLALTLGGGQLILAEPYPELAAFVPSALSIVALVLLSKTPLYNQEWAIKNSKIKKDSQMGELLQEERKKEKENKSHIFQAFLPYILVILFYLPVIMFPPLNDWVSPFSFGPGFKETKTALGFTNPSISQYSPLSIFKHASFFLFLSSFLSFLYYKRTGAFIGKKHFTRKMSRAAQKSLFPATAIMSLIGIARVMTGTGQTIILAEGMANVLKGSYVYIAPLVGMIGSFLTVGNMSSNILFGNFQYYTAEIIGLNPASVMGAQTAAGALGMLIAPSVIVVATATIGLSGKEGKIIMKLVPFVLIMALMMGVLLAFLN